MLRFIRIGFLFLVVCSFVSAECDNGQIDINSASLGELDEIIWVGPATAQKIIDARPYNSVDGLTKVNGIGEIKLADIKEEGLACVEDEELEENEVIEDVVDDQDSSGKDHEGGEELEKTIYVAPPKNPEVIALNEQNSEPRYQLIYESKNAKILRWLPYAFSAFLIFIIGILLWERF